MRDALVVHGQPLRAARTLRRRNPFEPYAIAAVELADEKLAILGGHKGFTGLFSNRPIGLEVTIPLWVFDRRRGIQPGRAAAGPRPGQ